MVSNEFTAWKGFMTTHRLSDRVVWLVGHASLHAQRLIQERLASSELRKQHYPILASLVDVGPAAQAVLADRIGFDRSDLVSLLDELEHLAWWPESPTQSTVAARSSISPSKGKHLSRPLTA